MHETSAIRILSKYAYSKGFVHGALLTLMPATEFGRSPETGRG